MDAGKYLNILPRAIVTHGVDEIDDQITADNDHHLSEKEGFS